MTPVRVSTFCGFTRFTTVLSPTWPWWLRPQHLTVASVMIEQVVEPPAVTPVAVVMANTDTGVRRVAIVPSPSA